MDVLELPSRKWRKTGVLWWSLIDMWPMGFNYSVADYAFRPKQPAYDWIRASQQPLCLMVVESDDGVPELFAANDTLQRRNGEYRVRALDRTGRESPLLTGAFDLAPNENARLNASLDITGAAGAPPAQALWLIDWICDGAAGRNHYVSGAPPFDLETYRSWVDHLSEPADS